MARFDMAPRTQLCTLHMRNSVKTGKRGAPLQIGDRLRPVHGVRQRGDLPLEPPEGTISALPDAGQPLRRKLATIAASRRA